MRMSSLAVILAALAVVPAPAAAAGPFETSTKITKARAWRVTDGSHRGRLMVAVTVRYADVARSHLPRMGGERHVATATVRARGYRTARHRLPLPAGVARRRSFTVEHRLFLRRAPRRGRAAAACCGIDAGVTQTAGPADQDASRRVSPGAVGTVSSATAQPKVCSAYSATTGTLSWTFYFDTAPDGSVRFDSYQASTIDAGSSLSPATGTGAVAGRAFAAGGTLTEWDSDGNTVFTGAADLSGAISADGATMTRWALVVPTDSTRDVDSSAAATGTACDDG